MENKEQLIEWLDAYVKGTMPEDEKKALEERLSGDPAFREEWEEMKRLVTGIHRQAFIRVQTEKNRAIHEKMLARQQEEARRRAGKRRLLFSFLAVAAVASLLVAAIVWLAPLRETPEGPIGVETDSVATKTEESIAERPGEKNQLQPSPPPPEKPFERQEDRVGQLNTTGVLKGALQVKSLRAQDGRATTQAGGEEVAVEIYPDTSSQQTRYRFREGSLKIYAAQPEDFAPEKLAIVSLQEADGPKRFFLKSDAGWHPLISGGTRILEAGIEDRIQQLLEAD